MGRLDNIQTALKYFKISEKKYKYIFMTILGLDESFSDEPTRP